MNIITVDFETYYDKEYSLRKMTTESYIRDRRFEVIGVSIKVNDDPAQFYTGPSISSVFTSLPFSTSAVLCHNTAFDGAILSWRYGIKPKFWLDTMSMARPLHGQTIGVSLAKLAEHYNVGVKGGEVRNAVGKHLHDFSDYELSQYCNYCKNDSELTYRLFKLLRPSIPKHELAIIDMTIRMFTDPVFELNKPLLENHLVTIRDEKLRLLTEVLATGGGTKDQLMSNPQLADLLRTLGVEPPTKISKTTGKETYAFAKTDKEFKQLLEHDNPHVQAIVAARLGVKSTLEETRTQSFIEIAKRGPLPVMLNYWAAHTGRFGGADGINLQNLPRKSALRDAIAAPPGHIVLAGDSSQIEARIVAWLARQDDLLDAFHQGRDVYAEFASKIYGRPIDKELDTVERFIGKTCVLGLGYGMGPDKFRATLASGAMGMTVEMGQTEAKNVVALYRTTNSKIRDMWFHANACLPKMLRGDSDKMFSHIDIRYAHTGITLPTGMEIKYPDLMVEGTEFNYKSRRGYTKIYGGKIVENITQALAQVLIKEQMLRLWYECGIRPVLQAHDEIVSIVSEDKAEWAAAETRRIMRIPPAWAPDLPVACEVKYGATYGDAK